jgi:hopanoid biosynthesis associated protein HpnK
VVIEGPAVLPHAEIPDLVDEQGLFPSNGGRLGLRYFFLPDVRRQLRAEIAAQFKAFAETGLRLDHADAHKHMHLHPTVGRMVIDVGFSYRLPAIRVPCEPVSVMKACGVKPDMGARAMQLWSRVLRRQAEHVGLVVNDQVFGLAWSGAMTEERLLDLAGKLPDGLSEIYFHPAAGPCRLVDRLMPEYRHEAELAALCSPRVREAFASVQRVAYGDL